MSKRLLRGRPVHHNGSSEDDRVRLSIMTRDHPSGPPLGRPAHPRRGADSPGAELPLSHESPTQDPGKLLDTFPTYPGQARCNCTVMAIVTARPGRGAPRGRREAGTESRVTAGDGERAAWATP